MSGQLAPPAEHAALSWRLRAWRGEVWEARARGRMRLRAHARPCARRLPPPSACACADGPPHPTPHSHSHMPHAPRRGWRERYDPLLVALVCTNDSAVAFVDTLWDMARAMIAAVSALPLRQPAAAVCGCVQQAIARSAGLSTPSPCWRRWSVRKTVTTTLSVAWSSRRHGRGLHARWYAWPGFCGRTWACAPSPSTCSVDAIGLRIPSLRRLLSGCAV